MAEHAEVARRGRPSANLPQWSEATSRRFGSPYDPLSSIRLASDCPTNVPMRAKEIDHHLHSVAGLPVARCCAAVHGVIAELAEPAQLIKRQSKFEAGVLLLALLFDGVILGATRLMTPWQRAGEASIGTNDML